MEYPKNTTYCPAGTFGRRMMQNTAYTPTVSEKPHKKEPSLEGASLAMVYSPIQRFEELYEPAEALCRGTLFRCLDMPFTGRRVPS